MKKKCVENITSLFPFILVLEKHRNPEDRSTAQISNEHAQWNTEGKKSIRRGFGNGVPIIKPWIVYQVCWRYSWTLFWQHVLLNIYHVLKNNLENKYLKSIFRVTKGNTKLISRSFQSQFVVPEFGYFCRQIVNIYEKCKSNTGGKVNYDTSF